MDKNGEIAIVDALDNDALSFYTFVVEIERRNRIKFFSWNEDVDFIETVEWMAQSLECLAKGQ